MLSWPASREPINDSPMDESEAAIAKAADFMEGDIGSITAAIKPALQPGGRKINGIS